MSLSRPITPDGISASAGSFASFAPTATSYGDSLTVSTRSRGSGSLDASVITVELKDPKHVALRNRFEALLKGTLAPVDAARERAALTRMIQGNMQAAQIPREDQAGVQEFVDKVFDHAEQLQKRSDPKRCGDMDWLLSPFCDFDWASAMGILFWLAVGIVGTLATYVAIAVMVKEALHSLDPANPHGMRALYDRIFARVNRDRDVELGPVPPLQVPPPAHST